MAYEDEIKNIKNLFTDFTSGRTLPASALDEESFHNKLWNILDDLSDIAYQNGRSDCACDGEDYW